MSPPPSIGRVLRRRLLWGLVTLWGITVVTFALSRLAPGGPADVLLSEAFRSGARVDDAHREQIERTFGLDRSLPAQYADWLSRSLRLDFGRSLSDGESVRTKVGRAAGVTIRLQALSLALVFGLALPLGVWAARRRGTLREQALSLSLVLVYSIPAFVAASFLLWCFPELPSYGHESMDATDEGGLAALVDALRHLTLPALCLAAAGVVVVSRYVREGVLEASQQDFVRAVRARGISESRILWRHVVRNGLIPVATLIGFVFPALVGGSVVVEQVFSIPGLGLLMFDAIGSRDYPTVMAIATLTGVATLVGFLVSDLLYVVLDPRIRLS